MKKKEFQPIASSNRNYINRVTNLFSQLTDAPKDVHEVYALFHLSCACMDLRWEVRTGSGRFIRMNLYFTYSGESTEARKSTCMEINQDFMKGALSYGPENIGPFFRGDTFTPQGLRDGMVDRKGIPTIVAFDEMDDIFEAISNKRSPLAQLPQMFKKLYSSPDYYTRHSAQGKAAGAGDIMIDNSYLCMIGNITPAAPKRISEGHLVDGFFARIHIIKATEDYERMSKYEWEQIIKDDPGFEPRVKNEEKSLQSELAKIENAVKQLPEAKRIVIADMDTLKAMNDYEARVDKQKAGLDTGHPGNYSLARIQDTFAKIAILIAVGRMGGDDILRAQGVEVTTQDVADAGRFCDKLIENVLDFIGLASGSEDVQRSKDFTRWALKIMSETGKDYFLDRDIARKARAKYKSHETRDALLMMQRAEEIVGCSDEDGRMAYRLSKSIIDAGGPALRYEPVPQDKNEDPKVPGEDTPF